MTPTHHSMCAAFKCAVRDAGRGQRFSDQWTVDEVFRAFQESPDTLRQALRHLAETPARHPLRCAVSATRLHVAPVRWNDGCMGRRVTNRYGTSPSGSSTSNGTTKPEWLSTPCPRVGRSRPLPPMRHRQSAQRELPWFPEPGFSGAQNLTCDSPGIFADSRWVHTSLADGRGARSPEFDPSKRARNGCSNPRIFNVYGRSWQVLTLRVKRMSNARERTRGRHRRVDFAADAG
jgi:hypothetical protein